MVCSVDLQKSLALRGEALLRFSGRLSTTARIFDRRPLIDLNLEAMKIAAQRKRMTRTTDTRTKACVSSSCGLGVMGLSTAVSKLDRNLDEN
jgi:hypothetical protein